MNAAAPPLCACGHPEDMHTHYRAGMDCGWCECPAYRPRLRDVATRFFRRLYKGNPS